jgi:hypothetical protein
MHAPMRFHMLTHALMEFHLLMHTPLPFALSMHSEQCTCLVCRHINALDSAGAKSQSAWRAWDGLCTRVWSLQCAHCTVMNHDESMMANKRCPCKLRLIHYEEMHRLVAASQIFLLLLRYWATLRSPPCQHSITAESLQVTYCNHSTCSNTNGKPVCKKLYFGENLGDPLFERFDRTPQARTKPGNVNKNLPLFLCLLIKNWVDLD